MERAVSNDGFKTVFTLRLSPLLPIPLGMYSYVYGASTSLALPEFLGGTFVASLKPYTLDAYLGVFAKSVVDGDPGDNDAVLLATFAAVVLIGTLASQIATRTWEEVQAELALERAEEGEAEEDQPGDGFAWLGFFGQSPDEEGLRKWLTTSWQRLRELLEAEHAAATYDLPKPPEVPKDWESRQVPLEFAALSHGDADDLYNEFLTESTVMWLVILQGLWQFSGKEAPLPPLELSVAAAQQAMQDQQPLQWPRKDAAATRGRL